MSLAVQVALPSNRDIDHYIPIKMPLKSYGEHRGLAIDRGHTCYEDSFLMCVFQEFVAYPNVAEALKEFCAEKETNVTVLMGLHIDGDQIQRDIAVFSSAKPRVAQEVCFFIITHILCILYKERKLSIIL
jgi:hypothetical protein